MEGETNPWDRQEGERNRWYQRFNAFRLQGPGRSLESVYRVECEAKHYKIKRPSSVWYSHAENEHWRERAAAWDQFITDQKEAEFISRQMGANEVKAGLADIARGNLADLMDITTSGFTLQLATTNEDGELVINPNTKLIKKIKQKVTTYLGKSESDEDREVIETEIELYSAHEAYRDLGKIHGLFVDRQEVTVTEPIQFVEVELPPEDQDNVSDSDAESLPGQ
jgi:predicted transcriptional regulator